MIPRDSDDLFEHDDAPLDDALRALIAQADAAPTLRPSRDLWPGIAARLDATSESPPSDGATPSDGRVLVFRARDDVGRAIAPPRPIPPRWLAAAAVALMAVSSGATYLVTRSSVSARVGDARPSAVAAVDASPRIARRDDPPRNDPPRDRVETAARETPAPASSAAVERFQAPTARLMRPTLRSVVRSLDAGVPGAADYDREIAALRAVVLDRQGDLDSATVDVLARNLRIIDAAIAASRAALARDPRSPFLGEQLTRALGQKVDLLRTAALLPRT